MDDAGSVSFVAGSGFSWIRAIQHYLVRLLLARQGQKSGVSGSFWPRKPALPALPVTLVPWYSRYSRYSRIPCIPGIPVFRVFPVIPVYSRVFPVFPCITVYKARRAVLLYIRPVGPYYCI